MSIGIVGLGYVGLPLGVAFAEKLVGGLTPACTQRALEVSGRVSEEL